MEDQIFEFEGMIVLLTDNPDGLPVHYNLTEMFTRNLLCAYTEVDGCYYAMLVPMGMFVHFTYRESIGMMMWRGIKEVLADYQFNKWLYSIV